MLTRHVQLRLMKISASFADPPSFEPDYCVRVEGRDKGIINAWLAGIDMARQRPELRTQALSDALPVLPYRGGVEKKLKVKQKIGSLLYLAMWQGLRGDDLDIDMDSEPVRVCSRHGVRVIFTLDYGKLMNSDSQ